MSIQAFSPAVSITRGESSFSFWPCFSWHLCCGCSKSRKATRGCHGREPDIHRLLSVPREFCELHSHRRALLEPWVFSLRRERRVLRLDLARLPCPGGWS